MKNIKKYKKNKDFQKETDSSVSFFINKSSTEKKNKNNSQNLCKTLAI